MPLEFLDISSNRRLALFTKMMAMIGQSKEDPLAIYRSVVALMRQAFDTRCYVEVSAEGLKSGSYRITRIWREDGTEGVADRSPWMTQGVVVRSGGVIAEAITRGEPGALNHLQIDPDDPAYPELYMYRSVIAAPGGLGEWHNWVLVFDPAPDAFTPEDVEVLVLRVNLVGLSLKNLSTVGELRSAKAMIDAEVDRIAKIQRALLPQDAPDVQGLEVAAKFETFDRAGGDLYDYAEMPNGHWAFMIADASGHGPSAAVVSAMLNTIMHTLPAAYKNKPIGPAEMLCFANTQMASRRIDQSFVTAVLCVWDPQNKTLTHARAGHPLPLLRHRNTVAPMSMNGELPVGILEETKYTQGMQQLHSGDVVVMYTDGVSEALNEAGEMFGEEGLIKAIKSSATSAQQVLDTIWNELTTHQASSTPKDDQTVLVLRVKD